MIDEEAYPELVGEVDLTIVIMDEKSVVMSVNDGGPGYGHAIIETEYGEDYIIAESSEVAGKLARNRWEEMAADDPEEFTAMVGEETLVKWALNQSAGPGYSQVRSLEEWLDLWLDTPEEELASYDGEERDCKANDALIDELGFEPTVAYRMN